MGRGKLETNSQILVCPITETETAALVIGVAQCHKASLYHPEINEACVALLTTDEAPATGRAQVSVKWCRGVGKAWGRYSGQKEGSRGGGTDPGRGGWTSG